MELAPASFKNTLLARGFRARSVHLYGYYATTLLEYFNAPAESLGTEDVLDWIVYTQSELLWTPRTVNVALAAIRILFDTVARPEVTRGIRNLRFDHPEPQVLSAGEVSALFAAADTVSMRLAIALLYGAGLRISELLALRFEDIDSQRGVLRITLTKNRHARDALLPEHGLALLRRQWCERKTRGPVALGDLVLISRAGKPLGREVVAQALVRAAATANVRKRVYPHLFRHSFATSMIESGVDVSLVQKLLGHRSLSSTGRYIHLTAPTRRGLRSPIDSPSFELDTR